jgi:hypothetical protein
VTEAAVGEPELAHDVTLLAPDQPPQDLALDEWGEDRPVTRLVEEAQQPDHRVQQGVRRVADGDAGQCAPAGVGHVPGTGLQQHLGHGGRFEREPEPQRRVLRTGADEVTGDRQVDRRHEVLPGVVLVHPVAQREVFGALRDDRQHGAGHRRRRRIGPFDLRDEHPVDRGGPVGAYVPGEQAAELVEAVTIHDRIAPQGRALAPGRGRIVQGPARVGRRTLSGRRPW